MIDILIPARNEAETIGPLVRSLYGKQPPGFWYKQVNKVIVVDNGSSDATAEEASKAGALVIECTVTGKGQAIGKGLEEVITDRVMLCDGDLSPFGSFHVASMTLPRKGMIIGVPKFTQNVPWAVKGPLWDRLSGVRSMPTGILTDLRDRGLLYGYTVEVVTNLSASMRGERVTIIALPGVTGRVRWGVERREAIARDMKWLQGKDMTQLLTGKVKDDAAEDKR